MHILDQESPGLADDLSSLSLEKRRHILAKACQIGVTSIGEVGFELNRLLTNILAHNSLSDLEITMAQSLAESADQRYLTLRDQEAPESVWLPWFKKARLFSAISNGYGGDEWTDTADAVYEISKIVGDPAPLLSAIRSEMKDAQ